MQRLFIAFCVAAAIVATVSAGFAAALETPKVENAQVYLGPTVLGPNYKVKPRVRSDGLMRLFDVETPYGNFRFAGVEFTKMRLRELDAIAALDKMSQSDRFMGALGRAAFAPIQFGANLITNPVDTINRSMSGVANMLDRTTAGLANTRADRDNPVESLLGIGDTQRELAVELGVDPYTDFPPLAERLKQMADAMAGGSLPVKAGLALIPGGAGIAVSSVSSVDSAKDSLRTKTAAQLIAETRSILQSLDVPDESIERLVENRNFTPADLIIMARALAKLSAANSAAFVDDAAKTTTRDFAFYERRLAELMAARSAQLGGLASFTTVGGHLVNIGRNGNVIAVYPLDDLSWSKIPQRAITKATAELRRERPRDHPVFATSGAVTPMARSEMKKLGWRIVEIKPLP
jgi:hypothetical protein